jgi:hypothetical protein
MHGAEVKIIEAPIRKILQQLHKHEDKVTEDERRHLVQQSM